MFRLDYLVIKNKGAFIRIERGDHSVLLDFNTGCGLISCTVLFPK